jgi:hypothetical protein
MTESDSMENVAPRNGGREFEQLFIPKKNKN